MSDRANAREYIGRFSDTAKMPCFSYGISRDACVRGKKLRQVSGTVCAACYAGKGNYSHPKVQAANKKRLERLLYSSRFVDMFVKALEGKPFFRFLDTGDIPNLSCLERMMDVVQQCDWCRFWIPTREFETVGAFLAARGAFPNNVNVRISADYFDALPDQNQVPPGCTFSTVSTLKNPDGLAGAHCCPVTFEGDVFTKCSAAGCRACWDRNVPHVCYRQH